MYTRKPLSIQDPMKAVDALVTLMGTSAHASPLLEAVLSGHSAYFASSEIVEVTDRLDALADLLANGPTFDDPCWSALGTALGEVARVSAGTYRQFDAGRPDAWGSLVGGEILLRVDAILAKVTPPRPAPSWPVAARVAREGLAATAPGASAPVTYGQRLAAYYGRFARTNTIAAAAVALLTTLADERAPTALGSAPILALVRAALGVRDDIVLPGVVDEGDLVLRYISAWQSDDVGAEPPLGLDPHLGISPLTRLRRLLFRGAGPRLDRVVRAGVVAVPGAGKSRVIESLGRCGGRVQLDGSSWPIVTRRGATREDVLELSAGGSVGQRPVRVDLIDHRGEIFWAPQRPDVFESQRREFDLFMPIISPETAFDQRSEETNRLIAEFARDLLMHRPIASIWLMISKCDGLGLRPRSLGRVLDVPPPDLEGLRHFARTAPAVQAHVAVAKAFSPEKRFPCPAEREAIRRLLIRCGELLRQLVLCEIPIPHQLNLYLSAASPACAGTPDHPFFGGVGAREPLDDLLSARIAHPDWPFWALEPVAASAK